MDDLAAAAEVSRQTLYLQFRNKEGLFRAALEYLTEQMLASMRCVADRQSGTVEETLMAIFEVLCGDSLTASSQINIAELPRTDPGDRLQYVRRNGPYKLVRIAGGENKLPFGNLPRLLLAWVCTEAKTNNDRTPDDPEKRKLYLGRSLSAFMQQLGIQSDSGGEGGDRTRLRKQIDRLFNAHMDMIYEDSQVKVSTGGRIAPKTVLWWDYHNPDQTTLWKSGIEISEELFNEIVTHPVPLDMNILKALRRSSLGLDLYMWLSYKTYSLYSKKQKPEKLTWQRLYMQFGADPSKAEEQT